ncbi:MAG: HD domain-containing protein [Butyrivibrio sp.]|nr:HD domain-containing protein [Muribaculum sp.]MCM1551649.1 HD domain-containing protein [Butyrivibrio sp.]
MERIDKLLNHDLFKYHMQKNRDAEQERRFCRHDMAHFLDVARIGEIINLEEHMGLEREWIYAAALLHDIGKHVQYENGTPHELASAEIAPRILTDCGFDDLETCVIINAIKSHRDAAAAVERSLSGVLYRADKASRACFACEVSGECNWKGDKKNLTIKN